MNIKDYFESAYRIDHRINSKFEQLASYNALATRATSTLSGLPGGGTKNVHRMENIIIKISDLENEISGQIEELVELKTDITHLIEKLEKPEYRLVLELRYLCMKSWEQIINRSITTGLLMRQKLSSQWVLFVMRQKKS